MRGTLACAALAFLAGCSTPSPEPAPAPAPPAEPPAIQTSAVTPATEAAVPFAPAETATLSQEMSVLPPSLGPAQVEKTFTHHRRFFNDAYTARLREKPKLAGSVLVSFTVNADGTTQGARVVQSTLADLPFERAVLEAIARMNFPPAAGPTPVERYPLQFNPPKTR